MQTALITGATSGFGQIIAEQLAAKGYRIILLARSLEKADKLHKGILAKHPDCRMDIYECNLSSIDSILTACKEIKSKHSNIDLLILNAALWNSEFTETKDGIEETFEVNVIAQVLLFRELKSIIPESDSSKVIFTASALHQGNIDFQNIEFRNNFSGFKVYRQSKLGVILLTRILAEKHPRLPIYCVHPGVVRTQLGRKANWFSRMIFKIIGTSLEKGASTHMHLINTPSEKLTSGGYYANSKLTNTTKESYDMNVAQQLLDVVDEYLERWEVVSEH